MSDDDLESWAFTIADASEFGYFPKGDYPDRPALKAIRAFIAAYEAAR